METKRSRAAGVASAIVGAVAGFFAGWVIALAFLPWKFDSNWDIDLSGAGVACMVISPFVGAAVGLLVFSAIPGRSRPGHG